MRKTKAFLPGSEINEAYYDAFVPAGGAITFDIGGKVIHGYQCEYRATAYHHGLFEVYGISFPSQLRNAVVKRRSEYLAGRLCAQRLLTQLGLKQARSDIRIGANREPIWPEGVVASISHTPTWAICAAAVEPDVLALGVDIELEIPLDIADHIKQQVVDADEERLIRRCFPVYSQGLTVVFSAKESIFKAINRLVGSLFDFTAMRAIRVNANEVVFSVSEHLSERFRLGVEIPVNYTIIEPEIITLVCLTR